MNNPDIGRARAVADFSGGSILAAVELAASSERVFRALTSEEITSWWVRPGVFDTREWTGDVRVGGRWRASGFAAGKAYVLEGEFVELEPPRKLIHTWRAAGAPGVATTVTYLLERLDGGTRLTLRHGGFSGGQACANTALGWETSLARLAEILAAEPVADSE